MTLRRVDVALMLAASALLLNVKPGYWALVLLVLLIRPAQLGGRIRYVAFVAGNALVVVGVFLTVFLLTSADAQVQAVGAPQAQLLFILHQPLGFLGIFWLNVQDKLLVWTLDSIGVLGWFTIALPPGFYFFVLVAGPMFLIRTREDEEMSLKLRSRALLAAVGVTVFVTWPSLSTLSCRRSAACSCPFRAATWLPCGCCCCCPHTACASRRDTWGDSSWSASCWRRWHRP